MDPPGREARAAAGPFGTRIAHGYLTLSLLPVLTGALFRFEGVAMAVNYGLNRVRFPAPLPTGSTVRATAVIDAVTPVGADTLQLVMTVTVTADGAAKPCCVAGIGQPDLVRGLRGFSQRPAVPRRFSGSVTSLRRDG